MASFLFSESNVQKNFFRIFVLTSGNTELNFSDFNT